MERLIDLHLFFFFGDLGRLIKAGWIEEIKPREFYMNVDEYGVIHSASAKAGLIRCSEDEEIIKVREVLE